MNVRTLSVVAVVALLVVSSVGGVAQQSDTSNSAERVSPTTTQATDTYVVEQGESCQRIEPLESGGTVESFYDYRNHETHPEDVDRMYSSYGTTHLQEDDTSLLFLHEGTDGLSLVMLHDQVDGNSSGGVATFDISGVPHETEWAVQDDNYTGETNMAEWYRDDGSIGASWIWAEDRTDGGAINGGLNDEFIMTIQPGFNEDAEFYDNDDLYDPDFAEDGEIDDWEVLSGDADDPDRASIPSLDEPVTIRTGTCDGPSVTYDRTDGDADGLTAEIDGASEDDRAFLQPTTGASDGVQFDGIGVTGLENNSTVTFENQQPDGLPESPDGVRSIGHLSVTGEPALDDVSATVTFSVAADLLDEHDLEPDELALYERDDGDWNESTTELQDATGNSYEFAASVSALEGFAVAPEQPTPEESDESSMPGFGAAAALGAVLLLAGLAAVRTRDR